MSDFDQWWWNTFNFTLDPKTSRLNSLSNIFHFSELLVRSNRNTRKYNSPIGRVLAQACAQGSTLLQFERILYPPVQEINISHLGKRKIIFKYAIFGGYVSSLEGKCFIDKMQQTNVSFGNNENSGWPLVGNEGMKPYMVVMGISVPHSLLMAQPESKQGETPGPSPSRIISLTSGGAIAPISLTRHSSQIAAQIHILHCLKTWKRTSTGEKPNKNQSIPTEIWSIQNPIQQKISDRKPMPSPWPSHLHRSSHVVNGETPQLLWQDPVWLSHPRHPRPGHQDLAGPRDAGLDDEKCGLNGWL